MSLQSTGQLAQFGLDYDRRRRLLADEYAASGTALAAPVVHPPQYRSQHYGNALFLEEQMRLTDLLPQRLSVIAAIWLGGLGIIAALLAAYAKTAQLAPHWPIAPLDLSQGSSLPGWFSTMLLSAATLAALLVYCVRRHRLDDYQGRYRVWLWAAGCLLLVSVDQTSGFHRAVQTLLTAAAGTPLLGDGQIWWILPYGFLLGAVGVRLLIDVWESRLATAALAAAVVCYAVALAARLQAIQWPEQIQQAMTLHGAQLVGNLMVLTTMLLYGRHAMLDATGQLPARAAGDPAQLADCNPPDSVTSARGTSARLAQVKVHPPHSAAAGPHLGASSTTVARSTASAATGPPSAGPTANGSASGSAISGGTGTSLAGGSSATAFGTVCAPSGPSDAAIQAAEASVRRKLTKEEKKALRRRLEMERLRRMQQ